MSRKSAWKKSTWKYTVIVLSISLMMVSLAACASESKHQMNKGHDTYYSSNVDPQFKPSYPTGDNSLAMQQSNREMNMNRTMMNGQLMNDQQKRIMDEVLQVPGVNDAAVVINSKNIIVGIDVNNVGERARVVRDVKDMLERVHRGYQISVTAQRAMYDRIQILQQDEPSSRGATETSTNDYNLTENYSFMEDFSALIKDIGNTVTEPLR